MTWLREFREKLLNDPRAKKRLWLAIIGIFVLMVVFGLITGK